MNLMFNELSVVPYSTNRYKAIEKMTQFANAFKKSRDSGFKRIRSDVSVSEIYLANDYTLYNWLTDSAVSLELKGFLFGSLITPFINDGDAEVEDAYIEAEYYYNNEETNLRCLGLAAAHLYELPSISLNSSEEWQRNQLRILVEKKGNVTEYQIPNVFSEDCFADQNISVFVENLGEVKLLESALKADEKEIHLADHHGKKELNALCKKLKHNIYVTSMRSTDWGGDTFIRKIYPDGVIEITLVESQRKYALWVQTTGRNFRETEAIAKKLREKYS